MGWIQNLCDTYDVCSNIVGIDPGNQLEMLLPIYHTLAELNLIIYLNQDGTFNRAEEVKSKQDKSKKDKKTYICIPCSDESEGRSSTNSINFPHPLFDQVKYLKEQKYADNLKIWIDYLSPTNKYPVACQALSAVYNYISKKTFLSDLTSCGIKYKDKDFLAFGIYIDNKKEEKLWKIGEIQEAWIDFHRANNTNIKQSICYITGENSYYTEKYPKSINRNSGNAKLISGNDKKNFVFRGYFDEPYEAVTVGYESSQKAHQMLRWLIAKKGCYKCAEQAIFAWAVDSQPNVLDFYEDSYGVIYNEQKNKTDSEKIQEANTNVYVDYSEELKKALSGYSTSEKLKEHARKIVVMSTDASTKGRMSITYYRELFENEYEERIFNWHNTCKWYQPFEKEKDGSYRRGYFIGAPSFGRIETAVLGKRRSHKDESYDKVLKNLRMQLLHCIFDGQKIPVSIVSCAFNRAKNPLAFENTNAKKEKWKDWESTLCTTCALIKRYYSDYKKEDFSVELEKQRNDRDYLYGRLLAVADLIESYAMYKKNPKGTDERATNAMRYMTIFSQHPFRTWNMLFAQQLNPYIVSLNGAVWYINLIEEITSLFKPGEYESDAPLDGRFLLGFFAQRKEIFKKL